MLENETTPMDYSRVITRSTAEPSYLEVGQLTFTFLRTSDIGSLPLMSTLLIRPVNSMLNGTQVNCTDRVMMESQSSVIDVINPDHHELILGIINYYIHTLYILSLVIMIITHFVTIIL